MHHKAAAGVGEEEAWGGGLGLQALLGAGAGQVLTSQVGQDHPHRRGVGTGLTVASRKEGLPHSRLPGRLMFAETLSGV